MSSTRRKKIIYVVTEDWYFWSHRLVLAKAALAAGYDVSVATRVQDFGERIVEAGIGLIPLDIRRRRLMPWREFGTIRELIRIYRTEQPMLVHHVAIKPVIYGTVAARFAGVPAVVNALAGLGYVFSSSQWLARILRPLICIAYRALLGDENTRTIVQNPDDLETLSKTGIAKRERVVLIRGSGVDNDYFRPGPEPEGKIVVVLPGRILWDKGVGEFVEAARALRDAGISARFALVGLRDEDNPAAVPLEHLVAWQKEKVVEWWGYCDDMRDVLLQAHVVVLPSYREGLPKALIEAAASARPIVTTDVPGCREVVRDGENGILVPARDPVTLARSIRRLIEDAGLRRRMGQRGREIAEAEFSVERVSKETLAVYAELLSGLDDA